MVVISERKMAKSLQKNAKVLVFLLMSITVKYNRNNVIFVYLFFCHGH